MATARRREEDKRRSNSAGMFVHITKIRTIRTFDEENTNKRVIERQVRPFYIIIDIHKLYIGLVVLLDQSY
jgi:hypothetical protein